MAGNHTLSYGRRCRYNLLKNSPPRSYGVWSNLVDGTRNVERDEEHRPARIEIEAVDELGRTLRATGLPVSRCVFNAYPHMFCWTSLTEWDVDGTRCWGEDQDVWHPGKWRRFVLGS